MNPHTGYISPQFHCVYDDQFDSCGNDKSFSKIWAKKAGLQQPDEEKEGDYLQKRVDERFWVPFTRQEHVEKVVEEEEQEVFPFAEINPTPPDKAENQQD